MQIHLFMTGVYRVADALNIQNLLSLYFGFHEINFDISDYDGQGEMLLRIKAENLESNRVVSVVEQLGFSCKEIE